MSKLQRWNIYFDCITRKPPEVVKDSLGPWVSFEDAKKLEEENRKLHLWKEGAINFYPNLEGMEMHEADIGGCHEFN